MKELGLDLIEVRAFFEEIQATPMIQVKIEPERAEAWTQLLGVPVRRCYISDGRLADLVEQDGHAHKTILEALLPDKGSVMAGDYGEIITALYLAACAYPAETHEPKMWRLKSRRTKPSEGSDVVQFQLPHWPESSSDDRITCAEVKTKSTNGQSTPVQSAIQHSRKDRENRLAKTLVWLRERAILGDLDTVALDHLDRFIKATDHPPAAREFRAVAVISTELVDDELLGVDEILPDEDECTLIVISIPDLKANYESLFETLLANSDVEVLAP